MNRVDVRFVNTKIVDQFWVLGLGLFPNFHASYARFGEHFVVATDGLHLTGLVANPNGQRCAPIAFSRQSPIDIGLEKIAETTGSDVFRQPTDFLIVLKHGLTERSRSDEPTFARILNERIFACSPAEWIIVQVLFLVPEFAFVAKTPSNGFIGILDPNPFVVRSFVGESAIRGNRTEQWRLILGCESCLLANKYFVVSFAERRRHVDNASTRIDGDKAGINDPPRGPLLSTAFKFGLFARPLIVIKRERRDVFQINES